MPGVRTTLAAVLLFSMTLVTAGCVSLIKRTVRPGDFGEQVAAIDELKELKVARCRRDGVPDASRQLSLLEKELPGGLGKTMFLERMSSVYGQILEQRSQPVDDVSALDMERFAKSFADALSLRAQLSDQAEHEIWKTFRSYYHAYIRGEFVDRTGTRLSRPVVKQKIGNDTLSAVLLVFLEAATDELMQTPVLSETSADGKIYFPHESGARPTVLTAKPHLERPIGEDANGCGVSRSEARAIGFLSSLAEEQSSVLSGMVLESFGDVQLAFVVGGHYSVGDNETLAKLVKTSFEVASRRGTEHLSFKFFQEHRVPTPAEQRAHADFLAAGGDKSLAPLADQERIREFLSAF